jgi:hypothetical protein
MKEPIVIIACKVFENLIDLHFPPGEASQIIFMDYGLHRVPKNLKRSLQQEIARIEQPSLIVLGYGLCGNGLDGIQAGKHCLLIPRADDCIAILLGSYQAYTREFENYPGTYYLSKGWLESGSNPLQEYHEYVEKYGQSQAAWLMDQQYQNYRRLALVVHQMEDLEKYRPKALEVAKFCEKWGMKYEEILGSDQYIKRLVEVAFALDSAGEDFIVIPPGGVLRQAQFLRGR